jgi:hypothetical protein
MTIDQRTGDLTASGDAVSTIALDGGASTGRAHEIRYVDTSRRVIFAAAPPGVAPRPPTAAAAAAGVARGRAAVAPAAGPELVAELGNLRAGRIEIVLAAADNRADRIEASANVRLTRPGRTATGSQFTYDPEGGAYVIRSDGATPAQIVDRQGATCRTASGRSLTFYSADDRITIDGQNRNRTQIAPGACPAPPR